MALDTFYECGNGVGSGFGENPCGDSCHLHVGTGAGYPVCSRWKTRIAITESNSTGDAIAALNFSDFNNMVYGQADQWTYTISSGVWGVQRFFGGIGTGGGGAQNKQVLNASWVGDDLFAGGHFAFAGQNQIQTTGQYLLVQWDEPDGLGGAASNPVIVRDAIASPSELIIIPMPTASATTFRVINFISNCNSAEFRKLFP